ncbi:hypothetical protein GTP23_21190 [Pseudoduganella sp. FT93W]|uniref:Uncharacterized protein n=1 Tax=Duganella fentianensis TaxID=2692177 RepID=A0A845I6D0_9BURK|nr:hypothetical protein [Duganella fentianensis]MYN47566.1 hypothetical protein [Duganella fentianensis]
MQAIKALAKKFDEIGPEELADSFLNNRGSMPPVTAGYEITPESPEPGVLRFYCTGRNATSWIEEVTNLSEFRNVEG